MYVLKDYGRTLFGLLKDGLIDMGWEKLIIDTCLFTKSSIIPIVYVNDTILLFPPKEKIQYGIKSLQFFLT